VSRRFAAGRLCGPGGVRENPLLASASVRTPSLKKGVPPSAAASRRGLSP